MAITRAAPNRKALAIANFTLIATTVGGAGYRYQACVLIPSKARPISPEGAFRHI
jgi:hypothetical protein